MPNKKLLNFTREKAERAFFANIDDEVIKTAIDGFKADFYQSYLDMMEHEVNHYCGFSFEMVNGEPMLTGFFWQEDFRIQEPLSDLVDEALELVEEPEAVEPARELARALIAAGERMLKELDGLNFDEESDDETK